MSTAAKVLDLQRIEAMAKDARPTSEADYASERQTSAQNELFDAVENMIAPSSFEQLEAYCLKATTDEMIDEALRWSRLAARSKAEAT